MVEARDQIVSVRTAMALTGLSRTTLWRLAKAKHFPLAVAISPRRRGWRLSEIEAWVASRRPAGAAPESPAPRGRTRAPEPSPHDQGQLF
jgi:prophage regulatory protein